MKKYFALLMAAAAIAFSVNAEEAKATPRPQKDTAAEAKEEVKEAVWLTDFDAAKKLAEEKKLPILMDFTGSDWCPWCIRLDEEVFAKPEFAEYAEKNLVLLKVDFPRKTKLSAEQQEANKKLAEKYEVEGFPTIVLTDAKGAVLGVTGYRRGGAKSYVEHLTNLLKKVKKAKK